MLTDCQERELHTTIRNLRDKVSLLEETILQLKSKTTQKMWHPPLSVGLTSTESKVLSFIYSNDSFSNRSDIYDYLYSLEQECDFPNDQIIQVYVCKIRSKLKIFDIELHVKRGLGYYLTKDNRDKLDLLKDKDGL